MQIEIFEEITPAADSSGPDQAPDCKLFEDYATIQDLRARLRIVRKLGLTAQASILAPLYIAYSLQAKNKIPYPFLSKEQEDALAEAFPTRYKQTLTEQDVRDAHSPFGGLSLRTLDCYNFDVLPLGVLVAWNDAYERQLFST